MKIILLSIFVLFISCQSSEERVFKKLQGGWAIDEITYNGENYKERLYMNTLFINEDTTISLPESFDYEKEHTLLNYTVDDKNNVDLKVVCKNKVFRGNYSVKFIKNYDKKLLGIELTSGKTHIIAYKFLQNFDVDGKWW